ncbi:MAG: hemolysin III family protein [Hydrogenophilaceae bacterium]|jgi:hemolysin III|nr:hemolysin III family protein [Hydrogenophilaceae bacterium]
MTLHDAIRQLYPSNLERLADRWVHIVGLALACLAGGTLLGLSIWQGGAGRISSVTLYALCWIVMLAASALYNMRDRSARQGLFRRFDHAAIFLMIAGSYTPFTTQRFEGGWAIGMTAAVWAIALLGAAGKLFLPGLSKKIWVALYLALGWIALIALEPFIAGVPLPALILLIVGGGVYTLGVAFYLIRALPFRRAIWHGHVLAASATHYAAVLVGVVLAAPR